MMSHCFLTADECVEQTTFGNVTITVNFGAQPYTCADGSVLPQYGFYRCIAVAGGILRSAL